MDCRECVGASRPVCANSGRSRQSSDQANRPHSGVCELVVGEPFTTLTGVQINEHFRVRLPSALLGVSCRLRPGRASCGRRLSFARGGQHEKQRGRRFGALGARSFSRRLRRRDGRGRGRGDPGRGHGRCLRRLESRRASHSAPFRPPLRLRAQPASSLFGRPIGRPAANSSSTSTGTCATSSEAVLPMSTFLPVSTPYPRAKSRSSLEVFKSANT